MLDPRIFQLAFQGCLLTIGVLLRDFSLASAQFCLCLLSAISTQFCWARLKHLPISFSPSALITGMGLALLLRADNLWAHPLAACLAISSKFVLRVNGRHFFNPAALGLGLSLLLIPGTWFSQGQWGADLALALWVLALGMTVTQRTRLQDGTWYFLATYLGLITAYLVYLGYGAERLAEILLHRASNGGLLLFAFFMISDPMTLPNHPTARRIHCMLVAGAAFAWQYLHYQPHGPLWALLVLSPLVLLWDKIYPSNKYFWRGNNPLAPLSQGTG